MFERADASLLCVGRLVGWLVGCWFQPDALTTAAAWDDVQAELSSAVDLLDEAMAGGGAGCDLVEAHRKSVRAAQVLLDEAFEIGSAQS